jgi:2-keto-3-deoxy-L-rhamnonate aldolase RhmA
MKYQPEGTRDTGRPLHRLEDWYSVTEKFRGANAFENVILVMIMIEALKTYGMYRCLRNILWQIMQM